MKNNKTLYAITLLIVVLFIGYYVYNNQNRPGISYSAEENNNVGTIQPINQNQIQSNSTGTNGGQYTPSQNSTTQSGGLTKSTDLPQISPSITSLKITYPEQNANWKIGSTQTIKWELNGNIPSTYKYAIYLDNNIVNQFDATSNEKYSFTVPQTTMQGGSIVTIEPGTYNIFIAVFDGKTSFNPNSTLGKLVYKSTDKISIQIVK